MKHLIALAGLLLAIAVQAAPFVDAARGPTPIPDEARPPLLGNAINDDNRVKRNYSLQPPIIPHRVDGYQVTKSFNKCLDCHAREKTPFSQAVPVSATHYITRSGQVMDRISTRRYFCQQCHVAQDPVQPIVGNGFHGDPADAAPSSSNAPARTSTQVAPQGPAAKPAHAPAPAKK